jgi:hypothetical protein
MMTVQQAPSSSYQSRCPDLCDSEGLAPHAHHVAWMDEWMNEWMDEWMDE